VKKTFAKVRISRKQRIRISSSFACRRRNIQSRYPSSQTIRYHGSIFTYLLIFEISRPPDISVTAGPIGSKKIGPIGGLMVSQAPGPDRNRRGARGFFGPPKIKKSYFSDFFSRKLAIRSRRYFAGLLAKIGWYYGNFMIKIE
jgi:hypothetical protein